MLYRMFFFFLFIFCSAARNPFSLKTKKTFKACMLQGTIIGEKSFAHFRLDDDDMILGIGEEILGCVVIEIDYEDLLLRDHQGNTYRLRINESMKIGEVT